MIVSNQHLTAKRMLNHLEYEVHDVHVVRFSVNFNYRYLRVRGHMPCRSTFIFRNLFVGAMFEFSINFRVLLTIRTDCHSQKAGKSLFHLVTMINTLHFLPIATWAQCSLKEKKRLLLQRVFSTWPIIILCKISLASK